MELYKIVAYNKYTTLTELAESLAVLDEQGLRDYFTEQMPNFDSRVLKDYNIDPSMDLAMVELCDIMGVFNDNDQYDDNAQHYYVEQIEVNCNY